MTLILLVLKKKDSLENRKSYILSDKLSRHLLINKKSPSNHIK